MELIHRNLAIGIHDALQETFFEKNKYADKVIERLLKSQKVGKPGQSSCFRDFLQHYRWKRRLEYYMGESVKPDNVYKLIVAYCLYSKTNYKRFEEFEGIKIADITTKLKKGTVPTKSIEYSIRNG